MPRWTWLIVGAAGVLAVAFLLFRPDKLFVDDPVDESLAQAFVTEPTEAETEATGSTETTSWLEEQSAIEPELVLTGEWRGIDHAADGEVSVYRQSDRHVLRFEDSTDIQNGPDLKVWFLAASDYEGGAPQAYLDLGPIKGNVGGQNYELPAEFDPQVHRAVLIWCERFSVPFAVASLAGG